MFFFDALVVNSLLSYDSVMEAFRDSNTETYIIILVGLGILTMLIALSFNLLKFIVNNLESSAGKQYHTKPIVYTLLDLVMTIFNFLIDVFILIMTLL